MKRNRLIAATAAILMVSTVTVTAASPVTETVSRETTTPADGVSLSCAVAKAGDRDERLYTLTADGDAFAFEIGGFVRGKSLITEAAPLTLDNGEEVVAAVNGDHFSFATGIPLGMAISDGRLLSSHVPAYNADEYFFHVLGITDDGEVLTGENPTLSMTCSIDGQTLAIDRLNRTREDWEGAQVCLYTPDYGASTATDFMGVEAVIRVESGTVAAGDTLVGTIERLVDDNDAPIEDGTVVLSVHLLREETAWLAEGAAVEISFAFEDERWNDVTFAVGGNLTIVDDGQPLYYDYSVGAFAYSQPRSALGVHEDGTLVLTVVDGRSEQSGGLTANEMADYMAEELGCSHAILLDGGGSTAMAVTDGDGMLQTVNVPSEERPVGNTVLLVRQAKEPAVSDAPAEVSPAPSSETETFPWGVVIAVAAVVILTAAVVVFCRLRAKNGKND